jgi:hypothetical protein
MNQIQFIDFLTKLAPEGETALLVRQKPQLRGGELQFHADGAIKGHLARHAACGQDQARLGHLRQHRQRSSSTGFKDGHPFQPVCRQLRVRAGHGAGRRGE